MAGAIASVAGLTLLVVFAAVKADVWHVVSFAIFRGHPGFDVHFKQSLPWFAAV